MGAALSIFGKINEESPHFSLLKKTAEYEIRRYAQAIAVETSYEAVRLFLYTTTTQTHQNFRIGNRFIVTKLNINNS